MATLSLSSSRKKRRWKKKFAVWRQTRNNQRTIFVLDPFRLNTLTHARTQHTHTHTQIECHIGLSVVVLVVNINSYHYNQHHCFSFCFIFCRAVSLSLLLLLSRFGSSLPYKYIINTYLATRTIYSTVRNWQHKGIISQHHQQYHYIHSVAWMKKVDAGRARTAHSHTHCKLNYNFF